MKNTIKPFTSLIILMLCAFIGRAQDNSFTYQVTGNEPKRIKFVSQLNFLNLNCGFFNPFEVNASYVADYYFSQSFSLHFGYTYGYYGITTFDLKTTNDDQNKVLKYRALELGGRFNFIDKESKKNMKITMSAEITDIGPNYTKMKVTTEHVVFPTRQIVALRGGFIKYAEPVEADWNKNNAPKEPYAVSNGYVLKTTDGSYLGGRNYFDMHGSGFYAGISSICIINASWSQSGAAGGNYYKQYLREFYFDVLFVPTFSFDDILSGGKSYTIEPNADGSFLMQSLGWRIGITRMIPKSGGVTSNLEAGMRPGIKGRTLYFGCSIGITIDSRARDKK